MIVTANKNKKLRDEIVKYVNDITMYSNTSVYGCKRFDKIKSFLLVHPVMKGKEGYDCYVYVMKSLSEIAKNIKTAKENEAYKGCDDLYVYLKTKYNEPVTEYDVG
ncbi:MAG: hypothetical protein LUD29_00020 [Clostridia bacterium]|nr:hypothetical protein [Clostridia bacterium]